MSYEQMLKPGNLVQTAIDGAFERGGGKVTLLPGVHRSGTIELRSNVELHLCAGAVLQGGSRPDDYSSLDAVRFGDYRPEHSSKAFIVASEAENIAVTGAGEINGAGPAFYNQDVPDDEYFYRKPVLERPRLLQLARCRNVKLEGTRWINSAGWSLWLIECENVGIRGISISGDPRMINNDGIHFFGGRRVTVSDCIISTGDDAIVVRAGHAWENMERHCIAEDIVITNCVLESSCQGIRVGCTCDDIIRNCRFSNLNIRSRNVGIYLDNPVRYQTVACKGYPQRIENIFFDHISVESQTKPIAVEVGEGVALEAIGGICFSNIKVSGNEPLCFTGSSQTVLGEVRLSNIRGTIRHNELLRIDNIAKLHIDNLELEKLITKGE